MAISVARGQWGADDHREKEAYAMRASNSTTHFSSLTSGLSRRAFVLGAGASLVQLGVLGRQAKADEPASANVQVLKQLFSANASGSVTGKKRPWLQYTSPDSVDSDDTAFRKMLEAMDEFERISLAQSFQILPKIDLRDYGSFGLKPYWNYRDNERPKTYNEVPPPIVEQAIQAGRVDADLVTADRLCRQFIWVSTNSFAYPFTYSIDYDSRVVWLAKSLDVPDSALRRKSTFEAERTILEKFFVEVWDKLTPEQRQQVLDNIETASGRTIPNKVAIASLGGAAALAALSAAVTITGFAFYTTMSVVICTVAGFFGVTLPFVVYTTASSVVCILSGPIGWTIAAILALVRTALLLQANPKKTLSFVMALHFLKAQAFHEAGLLA